MPNGRPAWITLLAILLLAPAIPSAVAAPPALSSAVLNAGRDVSDVALSSRGDFAAAVMNVGAASGLPGCTLGLGCGGLGGSAPSDLFSCDFGVSAQGCRGMTHPTPATTSTNAQQAVDVVSYTPAGTTGVAEVFGVAGPGDLVGFWSSSSATKTWEYALGASSGFSSSTAPLATNVSVAPDGRSVLFATTSAGSSAGSLYLYDSSGNVQWSFAMVDAQQAPTHARSLAWARNGGLVAIGTPGGIDLLVEGRKPATSDDLHPFDTGSAVNKVAISASGEFVAAASNGYTFFVRVDPASHKVSGPAYSYNNQGNVQALAMSLDGERFASASGSRVWFFHNSHDSHIAIPDGSYDAGAPVTDLSYSGTGRLLVASAGGNVLGFAPDRAAPIWTLDAVAAGLDAPLVRARVSDGWYAGSFHPLEDAQRIVVGGKTRIAAFDVLSRATATLSAPGGDALVPTVPVALSLAVTNTGSLADNYSFVVQPPITTASSPWGVSSPSRLRLDPDAAGLANFTVTAPAGQTPGTYGVTVEVHAQGYNGKPACGSAPDTIACPTINLTLARSVVLVVGGSDERRLLKQGAEDAIPITVSNFGNAEGVVNLTATQTLTRGSNWPLHFAPGQQVRVPAGGSASVTVTLSVPNDAVSGDKNVVTLIAKEGTTATATKAFTAYVDAQFGSELNATNSSVQLAPGDQQTITLNVHNTGNTEDAYNVTYVLSPAAALNDWRVTISVPQVSVPLGQIRPVSVTLKPLVAEPRDASVTLTATSQGDPANAQSSFVVALAAKPVVTTPASKGNFLPGPEPLLVVGLVALAALARRLGARR